MKMPIFLPPELSHLAESSNDIDLFAQVTSNPNRAIVFLDACLDDVTWSDQHLPFIKRLIRYLTELHYNGQLSIEGAERVRKIIHTSFSNAYPNLHYNITFKVNEEAYPANSLLIAAASPYFNERVRAITDNHEHILEVAVHHPKKIDLILNLIHKGTDDLRRFTEEELSEILLQMPSWGLTDLSHQTEQQLIQYLKLSTIENSLHDARSKRWYALEKAATEIYNELYPGIKLSSHQPGQITATFYDLKVLTTLEQYKKIAALVSICKFTGSLLEDRTLESVIKMTPHLKGLDFSETTAPLYDVRALPTKLDYLNLTRAIWLNDNLFVQIAERCFSLSELHLQDVHWIGFESWGAISQLASLRVLDLHGMRQLQNEAFSMIMLNPSNFESVSLSGCRALSPLTFQEFMRTATSLVSLDVSKTAFDDNCLSEASNRLYRLETLDITGCKQISERAVESFHKQKPKVNLVH